MVKLKDKLVVYVTGQVLNELERSAVEAGLSLNALVEGILHHYLRMVGEYGGCPPCWYSVPVTDPDTIRTLEDQAEELQTSVTEELARAVVLHFAEAALTKVETGSF